MRIWQIPPRFLDKNTLFGEYYFIINLLDEFPFYDNPNYTESYLYFRWFIISKEIMKRFGEDYIDEEISEQQAFDNIKIQEVKESFSIETIRKEISILIDIWELNGFDSIDLIEKLSLESSDDILCENLYLLEIVEKGLIDDV